MNVERKTGSRSGSAICLFTFFFFLVKLGMLFISLFFSLFCVNFTMIAAAKGPSLYEEIGAQERHGARIILPICQEKAGLFYTFSQESFLSNQKMLKGLVETSTSQEDVRDLAIGVQESVSYVKRRVAALITAWDQTVAAFKENQNIRDVFWGLSCFPSRFLQQDNVRVLGPVIIADGVVVLENGIGPFDQRIFQSAPSFENKPILNYAVDEALKEKGSLCPFYDKNLHPKLVSSLDPLTLPEVFLLFSDLLLKVKDFLSAERAYNGLKCYMQLLESTGGLSAITAKRLASLYKTLDQNEDCSFVGYERAVWARMAKARFVLPRGRLSVRNWGVAIDAIAMMNQKMNPCQIIKYVDSIAKVFSDTLLDCGFETSFENEKVAMAPLKVAWDTLGAMAIPSMKDLKKSERDFLNFVTKHDAELKEKGFGN